MTGEQTQPTVMASLSADAKLLFDQRGAPSFWMRFARNRLALGSLIVILLLCLLAITGPRFYPVDPNYQDYAAINAWPSAAHPLGADSLGRDTLARITKGLRVSLLVAFYVELLNIGVGATLGLLAGYFGGWVDQFISRLADMLFAFPGLLFAILVAAVFGQPVTERFGGIGRLLLVAGSLALVSWPLMARYVRGQTLSLKRRDFITAAYSIGAHDRRLIWRHVLPNVAGLIVVSATLDVAAVVVNEAVLSLLGLGIQPPDPSIGQMIRQSIDYLETNWSQVFFPSLALTLIVLAFSFLGDGL
ncbi:MAG: ABC transporter permease, partial [Caldilineaceae bacterium]|nr:ABC transporter permease [Caldilineaceae bacterium]